MFNTNSAIIIAHIINLLLNDDLYDDTFEYRPQYFYKIDTTELITDRKRLQ